MIFEFPSELTASSSWDTAQNDVPFVGGESYAGGCSCWRNKVIIEKDKVPDLSELLQVYKQTSSPLSP